LVSSTIYPDLSGIFYNWRQTAQRAAISDRLSRCGQLSAQENGVNSPSFPGPALLRLHSVAGQANKGQQEVSCLELPKNEQKRSQKQ
jgi:hypothetical protein